MRCDANVSVRRTDDPRLGTTGGDQERQLVPDGGEGERRTRSSARRRRAGVGGRIEQETRLYDETKPRDARDARQGGSAHDYRYFPDPDLPPLGPARGPARSRTNVALPECPNARRARYESALGLRRPTTRNSSPPRAKPPSSFEAVSAACRTSPSWSRTGSMASWPPRSTPRSSRCGGARCRRRAGRPAGADQGRHRVRQAGQGRVRRDVGRRRAMPTR